MGMDMSECTVRLIELKKAMTHKQKRREYYQREIEEMAARCVTLDKEISDYGRVIVVKEHDGCDGPMFLVHKASATSSKFVFGVRA